MSKGLAAERNDASSERLRALIREKSLKRAGDRTFDLASGEKSDFYFDMKSLLLDPEGISLVAREMLEILERETFDFIGGLAMGAIPIVAAICGLSFPDRPIAGFFVRPQQKERGTRRLIEGNIAENARVVLVEDVTTKGGSTLQAAEAVWSIGCTVEKAITIVDRQAGAKENLEARGVELVALYTKDDFGL